MKLKTRGWGIEYIKVFKNRKSFMIMFDIYRFGLGIDFVCNDSYRCLTIFFMFFRLDIRF